MARALTSLFPAFRWIAFPLVMWAFLGGFFPEVWAHSLNMTGVKVRLEKTKVIVSVVAHLHELKTQDPATEISNRLKLRLDGVPFSPTKNQLIRDKANGIVIWQAQQQLTSHNPVLPIALDAPIFPEIEGQSTVITVFKNRQVLDEAILDAKHPSAIIGQVGASEGTLSVAGRFLRQGIAHIFGGIDHVLFLLSLLLLGGTWKQLLKIVTAFTLAHSITLSLAATGVFSLPPRLVEPVIALSIVAVAISNFRGHSLEKNDLKVDFRPRMAFGFGLIHGFGFAGALSEIGLPREALGWALLAFNCGVEIGQAILVLLFAPALLFLVKKWPRLQGPIVHYGSATVACVGLFWFIQRVVTP